MHTSGICDMVNPNMSLLNSGCPGCQILLAAYGAQGRMATTASPCGAIDTELQWQISSIGKALAHYADRRDWSRLSDSFEQLAGCCMKIAVKATNDRNKMKWYYSSQDYDIAANFASLLVEVKPRPSLQDWRDGFSRTVVCPPPGLSPGLRCSRCCLCLKECYRELESAGHGVSHLSGASDALGARSLGPLTQPTVTPNQYSDGPSLVEEDGCLN